MEISEKVNVCVIYIKMLLLVIIGDSDSYWITFWNFIPTFFNSC